MQEIAAKPIRIFLDFNAVIVNPDSLSSEKQASCSTAIEENVGTFKESSEENLHLRGNVPEIPETSMAVLRQPPMLTEAIEEWTASLKTD